MSLPHLRWHSDPTCPLGVSGRAKLVEEYDDRDRRYTNQRMRTLTRELDHLAVRRNSFVG
jgi:hypothetical protein